MLQSYTCNLLCACADVKKFLIVAFDLRSTCTVHVKMHELVQAVKAISLKNCKASLDEQKELVKSFQLPRGNKSYVALATVSFGTSKPAISRTVTHVYIPSSDTLTLLTISVELSLDKVTPLRYKADPLTSH